MARSKTQFQCNDCGALAPKWAGQCADCGAWNSLTETLMRAVSTAKRARPEAPVAPRIHSLSDSPAREQRRNPTGFEELDRAIGGGLVPGSVVLIGGDPGIGKSTLLIQVLGHLAANAALKTLYVTAEESADQVNQRASRLGLPCDRLRVLTDDNLGRILELTVAEQPRVLVIDSIQAVYHEDLQSAPGSVSQVRECAAHLVRYAKAHDTTVFLVGHVTKDGALAGPRVLEHMVDTVLYFDGDPGNRYRMIRAVKNRFGAVNELGVFAMTDRGLREVSNPSSIFLSRHETETPGSAVMVTREGTRPLLVEVQALVDRNLGAYPRRVAVGLDQNRLAMLLAVLHRQAGIGSHDQDIFINVVGGVRVNETAADLPALVAVVSSLRDRALPRDLVLFGEVGLAGEIRPVQNGPERLKEAAKHGFKRAVIPSANKPKQKFDDLKVIAVHRLRDALTELFGKAT